MSADNLDRRFKVYREKGTVHTVVGDWWEVLDNGALIIKFANKLQAGFAPGEWIYFEATGNRP